MKLFTVESMPIVSHCSLSGFSLGFGFGFHFNVMSYGRSDPQLLGHSLRARRSLIRFFLNRTLGSDFRFSVMAYVSTNEAVNESRRNPLEMGPVSKSNQSDGFHESVTESENNCVTMVRLS